LLAYNDENNNFKPLPFTTTRASSATVVNKQGLIETVGSGIPRIDFSDDANGALLLEPTRSNLFTYSEDFSQSYWNKNSASVTLTSKIAPNGTLNSVYNLVGTAANLWSAGTIGTQHTISFYIKSNGQGKDKFRLRLGNNTSIEYTATNEWVRYEYTETPTTSIYSITTSSAPNDEYDLLVWGGQSEVGSYATSYIPTQGSAVTRVAETCSNENLNVDYSGDYTLYLEHETLSLTEYNQFQFRQETSISYIFRVGNSISVGSGIYSATNTIGFNKFALSVGSDGSYSFYKNGSLLSSGSGLNANLETIKNDALGMSIKDIKLYNTKLSNAELQALTSN
jgi:hypothetical protein